MKALCVPQTRALYKPPGSWRFCTVSKLFLGLCSSGQRPFDVVPVDYHYIWLVASSWNSKAATQDLFSLVVSPIGTWGHLVYIVHRCPCTLSQLGYTASTCILHPAIICWIVFTTPLYGLQLVSCCLWWTPASMDLMVSVRGTGQVGAWWSMTVPLLVPITVCLQLPQISTGAGGGALIFILHCDSDTH